MPETDTSQRQIGRNVAYLSQLRLFIEELCCQLCRWESVASARVLPESIQIDREAYLGAPGTFADIRVAIPGGPAYFVEIKYGYADETLLGHFTRKYGTATSGVQNATKVVLVVDVENRKNWNDLRDRLARCLPPKVDLEIWDESRLRALVKEHFGVQIDRFTESALVDIREAIIQAKTAQAFGDEVQPGHYSDYLKASLLWHFGFWRIRQLRESGRAAPGDILPPGHYPGVAVLLADLCSFSSYVRDTPSDEIVREALTSFYSKARYQIINSGGMISQFVGDEVVALFGVPDRPGGYARDALDAALALLDIGDSVSLHWQRHIDRVQESGGVHVGMAMGDLEIVSLQPFGRAHMGAIGDSINMAARLTASARSGEIVVSNSFYLALEEESQTSFAELDPIEAKNVGRIRAWKLNAEERNRRRLVRQGREQRK
jgi:class 3 adenylate cyclase